MQARKSLASRLLIVSGLVLALPLAVHAGPFGGGHHRHDMHAERGMYGGERLPHLLRGLELNEAQRDKVFELLHAQAPAMREKAKALREARQALHELPLSASYDEGKMKSLAEASARAMADMAQMRARTTRQIYELLTAEQRKALEERRTSFEKRRGGRGEEPRT